MKTNSKVSNSIVALKNVIMQFIPKQVRSALKYIVYFLMDTLELLSGRRDELIPQIRMRILVGVRDLEAYKNWRRVYSVFYRPLRSKAK